jgi:hypothetical protein
MTKSIGDRTHSKGKVKDKDREEKKKGREERKKNREDREEGWRESMSSLKAGSSLASATIAASIRALKLTVELAGVVKKKNVALEHFSRSINTLWL